MRTHGLRGERLLAAATLGGAMLTARIARACLNDFEIAMAEQQLRGAYAPAASAGGGALPLDWIVAGLGGLVLLAALVRAGRAA